MGQRAETLSRIMKASTPTALGFFGVLLLALPVRFAEGLFPTPVLPLVVIFFWSIYGPSYLPSVSVFFNGLLQDLLMGTPLGLWPSVYLLTQYVVLSQRSYFAGREQRVVWIGFGFAAVSAGLILWMVMSLMRGALLPLSSLVLQLLATVAMYPVLSAAFGQLHRRVIVEV